MKTIWHTTFFFQKLWTDEICVSRDVLGHKFTGPSFKYHSRPDDVSVNDFNQSREKKTRNKQKHRTGTACHDVNVLLLS